MNDTSHVLDRDYEMCILITLVNIIIITLAFAVGTTTAVAYVVFIGRYWHRMQLGIQFSGINFKRVKSFLLIA
jgi:hypothetical protein